MSAPISPAVGLTFQELANKLCSELPEGYEIGISCERDAGWVALSNGNGDFIALCTDDMSFEESVLHALAVAKNGGKEINDV